MQCSNEQWWRKLLVLTQIVLLKLICLLQARPVCARNCCLILTLLYGSFLLIRLWEEVQIIYPCKYRVSHKAVPTLFFCYLSASTHLNCKSLKSFENIRKFSEWWALWMSRSQQIAKNRSGHSFVGHPVRWEMGQGIKTKDQKCFMVLAGVM